MALTVLECENCGYARTSEEDGRMYHDVCSICYSETCHTPVGEALICDECLAAEKEAAIEHPEDKESLFEE